MRPGPIDPRPNEQGLGQIVGQVLHGHSVVGPAQGIEVQVVRGGQVPAKVVLVTAARVDHDGLLGGLGVDELLGVGGRDDADLGPGRASKQEQRNRRDQGTFHGG